MKNTVIEQDPIIIEHATIMIFSDGEELQVTDKQYAELLMHCSNELCKNCTKNLPLSGNAKKTKD
jgi:hypothetical protein